MRLYDGSVEPVHGHNWKARVTVGSAGLDAIGVVTDFHELERLVEQIIGPWRNRHLNDVAPFSGGLNPSAENVAFHIGRSLGLPAGVVVVAVTVWETDENAAEYRPG